MEPFKRILVDVDASSASHPALDRARALAAQCGASLRIVDVITIPAEAHRYLPAPLQRQIVADREARLAGLAASCGVPADHAVLEGRASIALIQEVLRSGHDLLVRSHARDIAATPRSYGAIDMQLFRKCPCPVWAVGPGARAAAPRVLAAVDPRSDEPAEQALNQKIIGLAKLLADLQGGSLRVLHAWTAFGEEVLKSHHNPDEVQSYVEQARATAAGELEALQRLVGMGVPFEMRKGHPEDAIPQFAVAEGIDTVVMGTIARAGIPGLVIGNTAERILQRLVCSVVAVKPDGFVSPVTLPE